MNKCMAFLLLVALSATMTFAAQPTEDAIRFSVMYTAGHGLQVTLVWKNITDKPLTLEGRSNVTTRVVTATGIDVPTYADVHYLVSKYHIAPGGEQTLTINPVGNYAVTPGEAYLVTITYHILESNSAISCTFPYLLPTQTPIFHSPWSQPSNNLSGRLRYELTTQGYLKVFAELKNDGQALPHSQ